MPSWELFDEQPKAYRDEVLPPAVTARVSVEQASSIGWERYVGPHGRIIAMTTFGASAPLKALQRKFGFEPDLIVAAAEDLLSRKRETQMTDPVLFDAPLRLPVFKSVFRSVSNAFKTSYVNPRSPAPRR